MAVGLILIRNVKPALNAGLKIVNSSQKPIQNFVLSVKNSHVKE
jgi:hypothetical protein